MEQEAIPGTWQDLPASASPQYRGVLKVLLILAAEIFLHLRLPQPT